MQWRNFRNLAVNNMTIEPYYKFHAHDRVILVTAWQPRCVNSKPAKRDMRLSSYQSLGYS